MFDFQTSSEASFEDGPWCLSSKSSRTIHFVESLTGSGKSKKLHRGGSKNNPSLLDLGNPLLPQEHSILFSIYILYILHYLIYSILLLYIYSIYSILFSVYIFPTFSPNNFISKLYWILGQTRSHKTKIIESFDPNSSWP